MPKLTFSGCAVVSGATLIVVVLLGAVLNHAATGWVEGPGLRAMLEKETAKGMHFGTVHFEPITRVGLFGMKSNEGQGEKGFKTIVSLKGNQITGAFNPLGIFLKRWQLQYLHFSTGTVSLQKTEGSGKSNPPGQPWYLFFWPDRVYLKDIKVDDADVLFQLQNKESGIYHTLLDITPNGRDFEYDATHGTFKTPVTPELNVEHIHLLVRKPRLYCPTMILGDDPTHPEQQIRVTGEAGLQQDRGIKLTADLDHLAVSPWLPEKMRKNLTGQMSGHFDYTSTGTGLETSKVSGHLAVLSGVLHDLKAIHTYAKATGSPDPSELPLKVCETDVRMDQGSIVIENLAVESPGAFRVTGKVTLAKDKSLSGELEVGLTDPYLHWLPTAETAIFTRVDGPYHFATVQVSGTSAKPQQDLTPRILHELGKHPLVGLKLFINASGSLF